MVRIRFPPADSPFSPAATFEGREPPLSARVWAAGLATGSARDAPGFPFRANRRQYLCRAIFRYPMPLMWSAIIPRRSQQSRVFSVLNACVDLIQIGLKQSRARSADRSAATCRGRGPPLPVPHPDITRAILDGHQPRDLPGSSWDHSRLSLKRDRRFADSPLEESGFEPSVPLGEKRSFRNASIRELHRAAYRGGRKRYRRGRPSGNRRSDHSHTATASELQVRPVG